MKQFIEPFDYAREIMEATKKGVLLNTRDGDFVNSMSISWGTMGIQWNQQIFTVFVRGSRFTKPVLDKTGVFTVSLPLDDCDRNIIRYCGTKSGRDTDKLKDLGLHTEEAEVNGVPGIRELPLTLECKVLYAQQQYPENMTDPEPHAHYAKDCGSIEQEYHTAYYGQIVSAYIIK